MRRPRSHREELLPVEVALPDNWRCSRRKLPAPLDDAFTSMPRRLLCGRLFFLLALRLCQNGERQEIGEQY